MFVHASFCSVHARFYRHTLLTSGCYQVLLLWGACGLLICPQVNLYIYELIFKNLSYVCILLWVVVTIETELWVLFVTWDLGTFTSAVSQAVAVWSDLYKKQCEK